MLGIMCPLKDLKMPLTAEPFLKPKTVLFPFALFCFVVSEVKTGTFGCQAIALVTVLYL